ncbi:MAG: ABC transporter ATP-binding protein [Alphaproteobacteria bacterium]|nr:ABC transporter ATP-binding protein [Alphaproteobacteria bacterium]
MSEPILIARDIVAGYAPDLPIVHGVSADIAPGEVVTIIGPNGAGKSTFVKALVGLLPISGGRVTLGGRDITGRPAHALVADGIAFVPQTANIFASLTIHENLVVGGHTVRGDLRSRLERSYAMFPELAAKRNQRARVLSGGQRQMLAIGRALMTNPSVVVLDEPTAGLAPKVVGEVFVELRRLATSGVAVLMVEQNARAALAISDRGCVLAEGRNRAGGRAADLLADTVLAEAFLGGRKAH